MTKLIDSLVGPGKATGPGEQQHVRGRLRRQVLQARFDGQMCNAEVELVIELGPGVDLFGSLSRGDGFEFDAGVQIGDTCDRRSAATTSFRGVM